MDLRKELNKFAEGLEQLRDEVKLQIHLAGLESKQEWDKAEEQWDQFQSKVDQITSGAKENAEDLFDKAEMIGEELKSTYQRIKDRLSE
ncbi:MAG: hypothetical protein ACU84J_07960 [Gammaproteobacteria bacterium]